MLKAAICVAFEVIFIYHNGLNSVADLVAELARFNPDPALAKWITGALQEHSDQAQKDSAEVRRQITLREAELRSAQTKIQALTLELAHLRRMRFGVRNEALTAEQRDLFQETLASDLAALALMPDDSPTRLKGQPGAVDHGDHALRIERRFQIRRESDGATLVLTRVDDDTLSGPMGVTYRRVAD